MSWIRRESSDDSSGGRRRIDKRRSEIESRALFYRDEQERVQKKTFTNWINTYLIQCQPPCKIADLFPEVKDGIKLLLLLEVLSGQKLPHESRKVMQRVHCLSNVRTALSFLESKKIKLVNINPADIVDGKPSIVLGLIWTIILYFQIEEQEDTIMKSLEGTELAERGEKFKGSAKKALLAWAQNNLGDKYAIDIRDFGNSWRDGSAFNAMVHNIDPSLVDMEKLGDRTNRENLEAAFAAAESGLNIPRLIDPE
uniref:Calponin-homology (CH) domain-containing protein n=1 Tax=Macrostomum lignano TaxID=282301 RepID=A0A1I8HKJ9_9PLAT